MGATGAPYHELSLVVGGQTLAVAVPPAAVSGHGAVVLEDGWAQLSMAPASSLPASMNSEPIAQLPVDRGVARSPPHPHVSNDNSYSEAAFKTLKYAPAFPDWFGSLPDACVFCEQFFTCYDHQHRDSGIALHTPASVRHGTHTAVRAQRALTLAAAYAANPTRFGHRPPAPPTMPTSAWTNQPSRAALIQTA